MDEELRESYRILEKRLFHEGRIVTPSFIAENNMLHFFQAIGLEPFLTLNEPICPRFVVEFYHCLEVKRNEEDIPYIEFKLGWELFLKEKFFCSNDKRNKVKACTIYMLYYLTIGRKFNFTLMIIYRMEEVIKKHKGPMPFTMLLTRLYNHILAINPQAIVLIARFTFHEHDPLNISRNPSKEKGKKITSPSVISSSSSSSDDNEAPPFLEFYDELSDSEDLTKAQREKRGIFKCLNQYVGTITKYLEKQK
ncbi:hypothetical protein Tco_1531468 [Tanacetum coccineum]